MWLKYIEFILDHTEIIGFDFMYRSILVISGLEDEVLDRKTSFGILFKTSSNVIYDRANGRQCR